MARSGSVLSTGRVVGEGMGMKGKLKIPVPSSEDVDDYHRLRAMVIEYVESCGLIGYRDDNDWKSLIFEEALRAVYGDDIFDYLNEVT